MDNEIRKQLRWVQLFEELGNTGWYPRQLKQSTLQFCLRAGVVEIEEIRLSYLFYYRFSDKPFAPYFITQVYLLSFTLSAVLDAGEIIFHRVLFRSRH